MRFSFPIFVFLCTVLTVGCAKKEEAVTPSDKEVIIVGTIISEGKPVPEVTVSLEVFGKSTVTDDKGTFKLSIAPVEGQFDLKIFKEGYNEVLKSVDLTNPGTVNLGTIEIVQSGSITGKVKVKGKTKFGGIKVSLSGTDFATTTADDGTYNLGNIPPGSYTLVIGGGEFTQKTVDVEVLPGKATTVEEIEIEIKIPGLPPGAKLLFYDDFSKDMSKWSDIWGTWEVVGGALYQNMLDDNCMLIVKDEFWDEKWTEYTFKVKAKKISGNEGFLIMFRLHGSPEPRGRTLRNIPPVLEAQSPRTQYWWNLGGWGNTRSCVERWISGARIEQANTSHIIFTDKWYEITIENRENGYTLYLDGEKIADVQDAEVKGGRIGLATWQTQAVFDDVLVYK